MESLIHPPARDQSRRRRHKHAFRVHARPSGESAAAVSGLRWSVSLYSFPPHSLAHSRCARHTGGTGRGIVSAAVVTALIGRVAPCSCRCQPLSPFAPGLSCPGAVVNDRALGDGRARRCAARRSACERAEWWASSQKKGGPSRRCSTVRQERSRVSHKAASADLSCSQQTVMRPISPRRRANRGTRPGWQPKGAPGLPPASRPAWPPSSRRPGELPGARRRSRAFDSGRFSFAAGGFRYSASSAG